MSYSVWISYFKVDLIERFQEFPYKAQVPTSGLNKTFEGRADIWKEVEAIAELAKTSKKRTIGHLMYDLIPLFACPSHFTKGWMLDMINEHHWVKNWNVSPGHLDTITAHRVESYTIIENELLQIKNNERLKDGSRS